MNEASRLVRENRLGSVQAHPVEGSYSPDLLHGEKSEKTEHTNDILVVGVHPVLVIIVRAELL